MKDGGFNYIMLLGMIFLVLKLCGVIEWSWVWVLLPFWLGPALLFLLVVVASIKVLMKK